MIEKYDYRRYRIERYNPSIATWIEVPAATISYSFNYDPDKNNTLIIGMETITLNAEFQGDPGSTPLFPTEQVRERYLHDGATWKTWGLYTVDRTTVERIADHPEDVGIGKLLRYRFTASLVGKYAAMMDLVICKPFPEEPAYDRLKRFGITVTNWGA